MIGFGVPWFDLKSSYVVRIVVEVCFVLLSCEMKPSGGLVLTALDRAEGER